MNTLTMWDSTDPNAIPKDAKVVGGYINGKLYAWPISAWQMFPDAIKVRISVTGMATADVYDVEQGDYSPSDIPSIFSYARSHGIARPSLYFSRSLYDEVRRYIGPPGHDWAWWCADATGTTHQVSEPDGGIASAVQWGQKNGCDVSTIFDPTWPTLWVPPPPPTHKKGTPMFVASVPNPNGAEYLVFDNGTKAHIDDPATGSALVAAGIPNVEMDAGTVSHIPDA